MYIKDLKKRKSEIESLQKEVQKIQITINNLKKSLIDECHHPKQYVITEKSYFSGSYYDKASTVYTPKCTICGQTGEPKTETHSWYG